ncbi:MAG: ABC transporter ATP-binding protein [Desulforhopalus sp.]
MVANDNIVLDVRNLEVTFNIARGAAKIIAGVNFQLYANEILALVGETGSGKSVTAKSLLDLIPGSARQTSGEVHFGDLELLSLSDKELQAVRGKRIGMIFQNPQACINPVFTLGEQIFRLIRLYLVEEIEEVKKKQNLNVKQAVERIARAKLSEVGLSDSKRIFRSYASEISGGMAQRFMIAQALLSSPEILIADEATSALDVTVQARILQLLKELCRQRQTAILFITHDLGIAAQVCDRVAVMYAGRIVEIAETKAIFENPHHPYTRGLLKAVPRPGQKEGLSFVPGMIPDLVEAPPGCRFYPRCENRMDQCNQKRPGSYTVGVRHEVACFLHESL